MKVKEIMKQPVVAVHENATLGAGIITEADFSVKEAGIPFTRLRVPQLFGNWVGKEQIEKLYEAARTMKAKEIMSSPAVTVPEDESIENVVQLMVKRHITRIPVVREKIPVGIIARNDLLKLLASKVALANPETETE